MKIGIIGYGLEGQAAYDYYKSQSEITVCDINDVILPDGVSSQTGQSYLENLSRFDLIVRSPIIKPEDILSLNPGIQDKITSNTNEFFRVCPTRNIIGITGTKGKGTTSTLIANILEAYGLKVHLGGNIGKPALRLLEEDIQPDDWVVLELSSFQLIDCRYSPRIGICLVVVSEHLDWHHDIDEYFNAKRQLFLNQSPDDIAIYFADNDNSKDIANSSKGWKIPYFDDPGATVKDGYIHIAGTDICKADELGLKGRHNWQNVCAAVTAVWQIKRDIDPIAMVLKEFKGLEHRLEYVSEVDDISFYDDSFGTTPETAIVAIDAFDSPKIVILGGSDKGASYDQLAMKIKESNVKDVILIGNQGPRIGDSLKSVGYNSIHQGGQNMEQIISMAKSLAQPGDIVLLSPACASFDMFKNYKDRGDQFKQAVLKSASNV